MARIVLSLTALGLSSVEAANIFCESHTYVGVNGNSGFDGWCQATCNQFTGSYPGFCPDSICDCPDGEDPSIEYPTDPRTCDGGNYVANPGTTASDAW